jgi:hypothetical protein
LPTCLRARNALCRRNTHPAETCCIPVHPPPVRGPTCKPVAVARSSRRDHHRCNPANISMPLTCGAGFLATANPALQGTPADRPTTAAGMPGR